MVGRLCIRSLSRVTLPGKILAGVGRHGLPQESARSLRGALETLEATDLCDICGFDTETDNLIVYCESCNMGVHQTCYGISEVTKHYEIMRVGHAPYVEDTHNFFSVGK